MSLKTCALAGVYNECDVIELFIRINSRCVDHIFVVDHTSGDGTPAILQKLLKEGYPITIWTDDSVDRRQKIITMDALRKIAALDIYDWIFLLDADEFLVGTKDALGQELSAVPPGCTASMNWKTYVPASCGYFDCENPIHALFTPRKTEHWQFSKVVIPRELAATAILHTGNHVAYQAADAIGTHLLAAPLAHCPVRSAPQIISKLIITKCKRAITKNWVLGEGFHQELLADFLRNAGYQLDAAKLRHMAFSYALAADDPVTAECDPAPLIGLAHDKIIYKELSQINLTARLDFFMQSLCREINRLQYPDSPLSGGGLASSPQTAR